MQSDNGSGCIARKFLLVLKENGLSKRRVLPQILQQQGNSAVESGFKLEGAA